MSPSRKPPPPPHRPPKLRPVGLRLSEELVGRLDAYARRERLMDPKDRTRPNRSAAIQHLLAWALDQAER